MKQPLLVEGKSDAIVISEICEKHNVKESFKPFGKSGDEIYVALKLEIRNDHEVLGVIVDADENVGSKWDKIADILRDYNYKPPTEPNLQGTILDNEDLPRIGVWIMPDNHNKGMLEDFVRYLIPVDDNLMPFVDETLIEIEKKKVNKYRPVHKPKARIHTWLAWQKRPGMPLGSAIKMSYLDTNQELCLKFVNWLNNLFNS